MMFEINNKYLYRLLYEAYFNASACLVGGAKDGKKRAADESTPPTLGYHLK